jgi:hypothetical protein
MVIALVPLLAVGLSTEGMRVATPAAAQVALASALADADSIDWVRADRDRHTITFAIDRAGEAYRVVVTMRDGAVAALAIRDAGRGSFDAGTLSWLADELKDVDTVARLEVDAAGRVTLVTGDDRRYTIVPGHGDGNDAARARWEAAWS